MTPDARLFMRYLKWRSTVQRLLLAGSVIPRLCRKAAAQVVLPGS